MIAMKLFSPSDLLAVPPISLSARTVGGRPRRGEPISRQWVASVDSYCSTVIINLDLAKALDLDVREMAFPLNTAGREQEQLIAKGVTNITFEAQDTRGTWQQFKEQAIIADIADEMLLGMTWLRRHDPAISWRGHGLTFREGVDPLAKVKPVGIRELVEGGKPVYVMTVRVAEEVSTMDLDLQIPEAYRDLAEAFNSPEADELPPHREDDLGIDLEPGAKPSFGPLYQLSRNELESLREYLDSSLTSGFIRSSKSAAGAPILFAKKKDGGLRMCVDYRDLNSKTIKNRYPLPLIENVLNRLAGARIFTRLDVKHAYHRLRIREGDEWKTAFRTPLGLFEYMVVPFGLANAPAAFQSYINKTLREYLDVFVVVYLDDIVVYSSREEDHEGHVRAVLKALAEAGLYVKLSKCHFSAREIDFLGYQVSTEGISMESSRVETILSWPEPESKHDILVFLGFANFYRRFITGFSRLAIGLTNLLKGGKVKKKSRRQKRQARVDGEDFLTQEARESFYSLKKAFAKSVLLHHFSPNRRTKLETDASGFAISGVLSQLVENGNWVPVAFYSRKMSPAELNYGIHDQELLAIVESFRQWRHHLEGLSEPITVLTDHDSLRYFETAKDLSRRQVRWAQRLTAFWFKVEHQKGSRNPADGPSRRPDYAKETAREDNQGQEAANRLRSMLAVPPEEDEDDEHEPESVCALPIRESKGRGGPAQSSSAKLQIEAKKLYAKVLLDGTYREKRFEQEIASARELVQDEDPYGKSLDEDLREEASQEGELREPPKETDRVSHGLLSALPDMLLGDDFAAKIREGLQSNPNEFANWIDKDGLLRMNGRLYIPENESLRIELIKRHHNVPLAGHFATARTTELMARKFFWPGMKTLIDEYCLACGVCQGSRVRRIKPYGQLAPLPIPANPWEQISMDFIPDLPASVSIEGVEYNAILVVVDRFSKMAHFIPTRKDLSTGDLAHLVVRELVRIHGLPAKIVTDRGSLFAAEFWGDLMHILRISRDMSTAYHPQTDGQTERLNSLLEQYLRSYTNYNQDDWVLWLPLAEFAYNNSCHASTKDSPFRIVYGLDPRMDFLDPSECGVTNLDSRSRADQLRDRRSQARESLAKAQAYQKEYYDKKHTAKTYMEGDRVWLDLRNVKTARPNKKLDLRRVGPCKIVEKVGPQSYRLELPAGLQIHNVFHVSYLYDHHEMKGADSEAHHPVREATEDKREYHVREIIDSRRQGRELQYKVYWQGYDNEEDKTWEPAANLRHLRKKLHEFHQKNPGKPGLRGLYKTK